MLSSFDVGTNESSSAAGSYCKEFRLSCDSHEGGCEYDSLQAVFFLTGSFSYPLRSTCDTFYKSTTFTLVVRRLR